MPTLVRGWKPATLAEKAFAKLRHAADKHGTWNSENYMRDLNKDVSFYARWHLVKQKALKELSLGVDTIGQLDKLEQTKDYTHEIL